MKEFVLLFVTFLFMVYLFANKDNLYVPIDRRPQPYQTKRKIINWFAWKGPMFVEDFIGNGDFIGNRENFNNHMLPSDPKSCSGKRALCNKDKEWLCDHHDCNKVSMESCRVPSLTSEHAWRNEYHNSSYWMRGPNPITGDLGNYKQTTNNNLDTPNQLKCAGLGRWDMETCSPKSRVSPVCYKLNYNQCMHKKGHNVYK